MEKNKKCSLEEEKEINAICYCQECRLYLCNKCETTHSKLFKNFHHCFKLDKDPNELFTGFCQQNQHNDKLEYFCKDHNILCCVSCICKIKGKGKGEHADCNVCFIEDIKDLKKNKLKENLENLENLSKKFEQLLNQLQNLFNKINDNKDNLKAEIQKMFTKLRLALNEREDELLSEVDEKFNEIYFDENIIKESEKLPNKIKISIEKGKNISKEWNDEKNLVVNINNCINIENNINKINKVTENLNKLNDNKLLKINVTDNEINKFTNNIKLFGKIFVDGVIFSDSLIINNNNMYINYLINWINSKQSFKTILLYRKSRDGDDYETFHKLCDRKGTTLVLIKSSENFIIGGYTPINWDNESGWLKDDETFVFSLTNGKVFRKASKSTDSIWCTKYGPYFAEIGFRERGKKNMSQGYFLYSTTLYFEKFNEIIPNEKKDRFFDVDEVEIYNIIFTK